MQHTSFFWTDIMTNGAFISLREKELRGEGDKNVRSKNWELRDDESETKKTDANSRARGGEKAKEENKRAEEKEEEEE